MKRRRDGDGARTGRSLSRCLTHAVHLAAFQVFVEKQMSTLRFKQPVSTNDQQVLSDQASNHDPILDPVAGLFSNQDRIVSPPRLSD
jgi:hypothetical protein